MQMGRPLQQGGKGGSIRLGNVDLFVTNRLAELGSQHLVSCCDLCHMEVVLALEKVLVWESRN